MAGIADRWTDRTITCCCGAGAGAMRVSLLGSEAGLDWGNCEPRDGRRCRLGVYPAASQQPVALTSCEARG